MPTYLTLANGHRGTLSTKMIKTAAGWTWAWIGSFNGKHVISAPKSLSIDGKACWAQGFICNHLDALARAEVCA